MSATSEQASGGNDADLQVRQRLGAGVIVTGRGCLVLFRGPGCGGRQQHVVRGRGSRRGAGQKLSQVAGMRGAGAC